MDLFNKLMDLLFRKGGSSAPRELPLATGLNFQGGLVLKLFVSIFLRMAMSSTYH